MLDIAIELQRQIEALKRQVDELASRDRPGLMACVVYRAVTQSFTGLSQLSWDTIKFDTSNGSMWKLANPTRLVAPADGWYMVGSAFLYSAANVTASNVRMGAYHQILPTLDIINGPVMFTSSGVDFRQTWTSVVYLSKGQYVEANVNQGFGVAKGIDGGIPSNITPNLGWIVKVA